VLFGELGNLSFAAFVIVRPDARQFRFVNCAMLCFLQFFSDLVRQYFHKRGSKVFSTVPGSSRIVLTPYEVYFRTADEVEERSKFGM
jgi:hypothetical protein